MKLITTVSLIFMTAIVVYASTVLFEKKGESYIQQSKTNDNLIADTVHTQDYKIVTSYLENGEFSNQLLDIKKTVTTYEGADGINGKIQMQFYKTSQKKFDTLVWQIKDDSDDWALQYQPQAIITLKGGCCGALTGARIYNINTGKLIMSYSPVIEAIGAQNSPFIIEVPNTQILRLVGVISADSSRDFPDELRNRDQDGFSPVAILKYATEAGIIQKALIKIKVSEYFAPTLGQVKWQIKEGSKNSIQDGTATLWDIDGSTSATLISGLKLAVEIYGENGAVSVKIPVEQDRFDLLRAEAPEEVQIIQL